MVLRAELLGYILLLGAYGFLGPRILGHLTFIFIIAQVTGLTMLPLSLCGFFFAAIYPRLR
jgi:hypothetical protein